jgi:glutathione S-transferase
MALPILYSYRRCPYAMRARMALKLAEIAVEIREISLRDKPAHLLAISPKGTVPVLLLPDGTIIEESLDIMMWTLQGAASRRLNAGQEALKWVHLNDTQFKPLLDAYKYPERFPQKTAIEHRQLGEVFLQQLEAQLLVHEYLCGNQPSMADIAVFPFVRQFAAVDAVWFAQAPYPQLRQWLSRWIESELFASIMQKQPT